MTHKVPSKNIILIEKKLKDASTGKSTELVANQEQKSIMQSAQVAAYAHALEMLNVPVGPKPQETFEIDTIGLGIIRECHAKATKADPSDAPFPLVNEEADLFHTTAADAYDFVLSQIEPQAVTAA